eukprot:CAMPEP_0172312906 /NCGR_PEP_ID=MMETSP1058-20130122/18773_1 /TAXON_ID=83371 /ORGANISM="Detonula confervacea, Strain CCMP 353" /LENGTH=178 /DNA_ID=CAMNT_0013026469 /DNA_START=60 /DNA_END=596 /DNA_ORIENTATION=+
MARLRSMSLRHKPKASQPSQSKTNDNDQRWEFHVTSNPKEYTDEFEIHRACGTIDTVSTSRSDEEADNTDAGTTNTAPMGWGWLLSSCWGGSPDLTTDDATFESSDDGTGDFSEPSMSRVDQVLELAAANKADDISDITSVSSSSIYDDDSNDSESKSHCTQDASGRHGELDMGNNCV